MRLDKNVLSTAKVQGFLSKNFVNVKLDASNSSTKSLLKHYKARGIPCLLVFAPNGRLKSMKVGAPSSPDSFISAVSAMVKGK